MSTLRGLRSLHQTWSLLSSHRVPARNASRWSRHSAFPGFFNRTPVPTSLNSKRLLLWLVPFAGGLAFYLSPTQNAAFSSALFASPTLIPCSSPLQPTVYSPAEPDRSIPSRILSLLNGMVWEPILTTGRFVYLLFLFMPVILSSPMLLVGGERWGAIRWYELLVSRMEAAGPTFIKVCLSVVSPSPSSTSHPVL